MHGFRINSDVVVPVEPYSVLIHKTKEPLEKTNIRTNPSKHNNNNNKQMVPSLLSHMIKHTLTKKICKKKRWLDLFLFQKKKQKAPPVFQRNASLGPHRGARTEFSRSSFTAEELPFGERLVSPPVGPVGRFLFVFLPLRKYQCFSQENQCFFLLLFLFVGVCLFVPLVGLEMFVYSSIEKGGFRSSKLFFLDGFRSKTRRCLSRCHG